VKRLLAAIAALAMAAFAQADPCKEETQKAENFYEICVKFEAQSSAYMDCIKMFLEQKAKASEICKAAPPAPTPVPAVVPEATPAPAAALVSVAAMSVVQALRESSLPGGCVADFTTLLESDGFSMGKFVKDLPPAVAKVKVQMKSPFGKPKDGDKTSVGLTVGCIKLLPESPAEIQELLKDIALKAGLSFAAEAVESVAEGYSNDEPKEEGGDKKGMRFGFRAGFNFNNFSFGYKDLDRRIDMGYGFGAGLALNVPIASIVMLNAGLDVYWRELFEGIVYYDSRNGFGNMTEIALSIPVTLQFGNSIYLAAGIQLDIPVRTRSDVMNGGHHFEENRSPMDFGLVLGLGYMFENIGLDFKCVYGLTSFFEDFSYNYIRYKDKSWLGQYGFGLSYFF
jgi:hypothetical protein